MAMIIKWDNEVFPCIHQHKPHISIKNVNGGAYRQCICASCVSCVGHYAKQASMQTRILSGKPKLKKKKKTELQPDYPDEEKAFDGDNNFNVVYFLTKKRS